MILSFDPVARELVIDREDGRPRFEIPLDRLVVKYYADGGVLFAEVSGDDPVVGLLPDDTGGATLELLEAGPRRWRVSVSPCRHRKGT